MNKVHVIVNPFSARGKTAQRWQDIKEIVRSTFKEFRYIFTEKPKQATEIARDSLQEGYDLIIGVGGDGTLNEITNGFFRENSSQTINDAASLGIIPSGTGSDFIRFMKIPRDFRQSIQLIKDANMRPIDVGKITFRGQTVGPAYTYFINIADFGLGAEVIKNLAEIPSVRRGPILYYKGLLQTLTRYHSKPVRLILDDQETIEDSFVIGAIANGRIFGGGMIVAPHAEPDDGFFDVVLIEKMRRLEILFQSPRLYTGSIEKIKKVAVRRARKIEVHSDVPVHIEYDGELGGKLPASFEILRRTLNFRI